MHFDPIESSDPKALQISNLSAPGVLSAMSPIMFAKDIFIVRKQFDAIFAISALSGDIRQIDGGREDLAASAWYPADISRKEASVCAPMSTMPKYPPVM